MTKCIFTIFGSIDISTHTLTWSVTHNIALIGVPSDISTHTLTWSVTCYSKNFYLFWRFQLTRSRGAWRLFWWYNKGVYVISTHTLTWSVTKDNVFKIKSSKFQLTRSRGAWPWCCVYLVLAQRDADLFFYLMGIGLILFTVHSQTAWHFHANLLGICGSLGVRWSKY